MGRWPVKSPCVKLQVDTGGEQYWGWISRRQDGSQVLLLMQLLRTLFDMDVGLLGIVLRNAQRPRYSTLGIERCWERPQGQGKKVQHKGRKGKTGGKPWQRSQSSSTSEFTKTYARPKARATQQATPKDITCSKCGEKGDVATHCLSMVDEGLEPYVVGFDASQQFLPDVASRT
eukprot:TRINITY_DN29910_c0_g1_i2.p1 TRINITY_DN29910_c0_g1~~TRINITY_DN29910_c0_g1_i2.p1  ORF type:complete len:174 (-),score=21.52 TRINITY_DN29910_c0_g1_i2:243-764(-)